MISYLGTNLGLAAAFLFVRLVLTASERRAVTVSFRDQLRMSRALLCVALMATVSATWIALQAEMHFADSPVVRIPFPQAQELPPLVGVVLVALLTVALLKTFRTIMQYRELTTVLRSSVLLRQHRRTVIVVSSRIVVPLSLRTLRWRWVVLPNHLLGQRDYLRCAIAHELQHHRQGDTTWAWVEQALSILFWPNPVIHLWRRWNSNVQEMACDEALLRRPGFEVEVYARCLLNVAERALGGQQAVQFAPSMATPLQRRIEMLFASSSRRVSPPVLATVFVLAICFGVSVSVLAAGLTPAPKAQVVAAPTDCEHEDAAMLMCMNEPRPALNEPDCLTEDQ